MTALTLATAVAAPNRRMTGITTRITVDYVHEPKLAAMVPARMDAARVVVPQ